MPAGILFWRLWEQICFLAFPSFKRPSIFLDLLHPFFLISKATKGMLSFSYAMVVRSFPLFHIPSQGMFSAIRLGPGDKAGKLSQDLSHICKVPSCTEKGRFTCSKDSGVGAFVRPLILPTKKLKTKPNYNFQRLFELEMKLVGIRTSRRVF